MRLIDADKLEHEIRKSMNERYISWTKTIKVAEISTLIFDAIASAPAIITARTTTEGFPIIDMRPRNTGEWIPVGERLPDFLEVVLVTDETGKVFKYEMRPFDEEGIVCEEWTFLGRKIIAWMPLPEAYKEADHE